MRITRMPIELATLLYLLTYMPYMLITRGLSTTDNAELGRPLTGLESLPAVLIMGGTMVLLFIWLSGWWRSARQIKIGGVSLPFPRAATALSGVGMALLLFTVPLSLTFQGVSIPFIQLLMRGDVLLIAPLVDIVSGRKVRWYGWVALLLVAVAMAITLKDRGGLHLPPLAILAIVLYTVGYFIRLAVMTRVAKNGDENAMKAYFVEEKIVGTPLSIVALALVMVSPLANQGNELAWGFGAVWTSSALPWLIPLSVAFFAVTIFSAVILLNPRENSVCVPFERAASILAGIFAAFILAFGLGQPYPTAAEMVGMVLLIAAIVLLSVAPRMGRKAVAKPDVETAATAT